MSIHPNQLEPIVGYWRAYYWRMDGSGGGKPRSLFPCERASDDETKRETNQNLGKQPPKDHSSGDPQPTKYYSAQGIIFERTEE